MTPEQYQRAKVIFEQVCDLPLDQRDEFMAHHLMDDPDVREHIERLLRADAADSTLLRTPVPEATREPSPVRLPESIGPYQIISQLGIGGMGTVYEAEQQHPRRTVALKVVTPGLDAQAIMKRFQREADLLGRLQHEGIAQVYDAGHFETDAGPRPYFAMELVRGVTVTAYADRNALSTRNRLALLQKICDAVQHAHDHNVIHRDLKPSNILVTDGGKPKILDFGIARPAEPHATDITVHTRTGQLVGTVAYMSPEQASGRDEIDHRADVYSLGVIAYELLTGQLPFDLKNKMLHEAVKAIQEAEAPSLSTISRGLSTDLDTIVRKALAKGKDRRYQTARDLANDIGRFLDDKPIAARPPSALYQLRKFFKRHRAIATAAAMVFVALLLGLIATSIGLRQAVDARKLAEAEQLQTEAALSLLTDALYNVNINQEGNANYSVSELLDDIATSIDTNDALMPSTRANLRMILGDVFVSLARYSEGKEQLEKAVAARTEALGGEHPDTLEAMSDLASVTLDLGEYERGHEMFLSLSSTSERVLGPLHPSTLKRMFYLASSQFRIGEHQTAAETYERVLAAYEQGVADPDDTRGAIFASLAFVYGILDRLEEAAALHERSMKHHVEMYGFEHPFTLTARSNRALALSRLNRTDEAEREMLDIFAIRERTLPPDHSDIGVSHLHLARLYVDLDRHAEAEPLALSATQLLTRTLGEDHRYTRRARTLLIRIYDETERPGLADPLRSPTS